MAAAITPDRFYGPRKVTFRFCLPVGGKTRAIFPILSTNKQSLQSSSSQLRIYPGLCFAVLFLLPSGEVEISCQLETPPGGWARIKELEMLFEIDYKFGQSVVFCSRKISGRVR